MIREWPDPSKYQRRSLFLFGFQSRVRRACIALHENPLWHPTCILCILANLVLLSMTDPLEARYNPGSDEIGYLGLASFGLANFFVFEALVRETQQLTHVRITFRHAATLSCPFDLAH